MTKLPLRAATALLATLALAGSAQAASSPSPARLGSAADAVVAAGVPGVAVYVRNGKKTITLARGLDDVGAKRPMIVGDRFRIGSVTKPFVAAVVLQLVHEGKLGLDDPVEKYVPGLVAHSEGITIRRLLTHTSGLADYFTDKRILAPYARGNLAYNWPHRTVVRFAAGDKRLFAPGAPGKWSYSNTGYFLLGLTVERVTGHSLASELARRIFRPLGLTHTTLPSTAKPSGRYAHGYTKAFGKPQDFSIVSPSTLWAAGGIISTPAEIAKFFRELDRGHVLPPSLVRQMKAQQGPLPLGPGKGWYGFGLFHLSLPLGCGPVWGHPGDLPGYDTAAWNSPDGSRQVVVAVNQDDDATLSDAAKQALGRLTSIAYCG
jgi:D-alanyl-D-alanine carboxypeptidase